MTRKQVEERAQAVKQRLMKPLPPEGAHIVGPWGWGKTNAEAETLIRKWRSLLSIVGLTIDEIAGDMIRWDSSRRSSRPSRRHGNVDVTDKDMTPRYAPKSVLIAGRGTVPVTSTKFYPPGQHPRGSPIVSTMGALELVTPYGSRWWGFDRGYINSQLRMVVQGFGKRDEIRSKWPVVPVKYR
jgi:hypothetical protein